MNAPDAAMQSRVARQQQTASSKASILFFLRRFPSPAMPTPGDEDGFVERPQGHQIGSVADGRGRGKLIAADPLFINFQK